MKRWNPRTIIAATGITLTVVACAAPAGIGNDRSADGTSGSTSSRPLPTSTPDPSRSADPMIGGIPDALLADIMADAAERAGLPAGELEVVAAEAVTFNDGSLGCPQPGMAYTQALVDGYHVVIGTPNGELDYRAAQTGGFRFCDNPMDPGTRDTY
jgi:hypothetical protein